MVLQPCSTLPLLPTLCSNLHIWESRTCIFAFSTNWDLFIKTALITVYLSYPTFQKLFTWYNHIPWWKKMLMLPLFKNYLHFWAFPDSSGVLTEACSGWATEKVTSNSRQVDVKPGERKGCLALFHIIYLLFNILEMRHRICDQIFRVLWGDSEDTLCQLWCLAWAL